MRLAVALLLFSAIWLAGCASTSLSPTRIDYQSAQFTVNSYSRPPRQLRLVAANGTTLAVGTVSGHRVYFRLPVSEQSLPFTGQCIQVQTMDAQVVPIAGIDTNGFQLPDWQGYVRWQYEGRYVQQQRNRLVQAINADNQLAQRAQYWLQSNPGVLVNGACQTPAQTAQPEDACGTSAAADNIALHRCEQNAACTGLGKLAGQAVDNYATMAEFAVSNGCVAALLNQRGEAVTADFLGEAIGMALVEELGAQALEGTGLSEKRAHQLASGMLVTWEFQSCLTKERQTCDAKYTSWLNAPQEAQRTCTAAVSILNATPQKVAAEQAQVSQLDGQLATLRAQANPGGARIAACQR